MGDRVQAGAGMTSDLTHHQLENERYFAACILTTPELIVNDYGWLDPSLFCDSFIKEFWRKTLAYNGDAYRAANELSMLSEVYGWVNEIPSTLRVDEYARAISEDYYLRNVLDNLGQIATLAHSRDIDNLRSLVHYVGEIEPFGRSNTHLPADIHKEFVAMIRGNMPSIETGIMGLDNLVGRFFPTELTLLAGRPGTGKTALLLQAGRQVAEHKNKKVAFFSLEMERHQLWARMACPMAGLEWTNVRAGKVSQMQLDELERQSAMLARRLGDRFIVIDDARTVMEIHRVVMDLQPDLVIIDQLDNIQWHEAGVPMIIWYGSACKYLRDIVARKAYVPVLMICQLSRKVEDRQDKRPVLSDLRESGKLEQVADSVLLVSRQDLYTGRPQSQTCVPMLVDNAKNRQGEQGGSCYLDYDLKQQWFK
jgi:replicative DNA helicase